MYARQYGFDALIARLFAFVGPHLPFDKFAAGNFIQNVLDGKPIRIESDGSAAGLIYTVPTWPFGFGRFYCVGNRFDLTTSEERHRLPSVNWRRPSQRSGAVKLALTSSGYLASPLQGTYPIPFALEWSYNSLNMFHSKRV